MANPSLHRRITMRGNFQRFGVVSDKLLTSRPQALSCYGISSRAPTSRTLVLSLRQTVAPVAQEVRA